MKTFVAAVLVTGALVGWFAPGVVPETKPVETGPPARSQAQLQVAATPKWYGGEVALEREADGHFYAAVRIETRDYRMLVDTGASMVALTGEDARNMGLDWDPQALRPVGHGANGVVMGLPVRLREVAVGDFVARDVEAVIVPDGLVISLLGQSFLAQVERVAISENTLTLSD